MIVTGLLAFSQPVAFAESTEMDLLVKMLVENGTLTKEQATILASRAKERAAEEAEEKAAKEAGERAAQEAWEKSSQVAGERFAKLDVTSPPAKKWEIIDRPIETSWDNAMTFSTRDRSFKIKLIGRTYADMLYVDGQSMLTELLRPAGDFLRRNDGAFIRSARLGLEGRIYEDFLFKFEYDF